MTLTTTRRFLSHLASVACLGVLLVAPAALADRAQCEATCTGSSGTDLQSCMDRCPAPSTTGGKSTDFQNCAMRCKKKFEQSYKACASRCPKNGPSGKEKAESLPKE